MNTSTLVILTAVVGIAGTFARNPGDTSKAIKTTVALAAYAFGALLIQLINEDLSEQMALLVFITVLFYYGIPISKALKTFWSA